MAVSDETNGHVLSERSLHHRLPESGDEGVGNGSISSGTPSRQYLADREPRNHAGVPIIPIPKASDGSVHLENTGRLSHQKKPSSSSTRISSTSGSRSSSPDTSTGASPPTTTLKSDAMSARRRPSFEVRATGNESSASIRANVPSSSVWSQQSRTSLPDHSTQAETNETMVDLRIFMSKGQYGDAVDKVKPYISRRGGVPWKGHPNFWLMASESLIETLEPRDLIGANGFLQSLWRQTLDQNVLTQSVSEPIWYQLARAHIMTGKKSGELEAMKIVQHIRAQLGHMDYPSRVLYSLVSSDMLCLRDLYEDATLALLTGLHTIRSISFTFDTGPIEHPHLVLKSALSLVLLRSNDVELALKISSEVLVGMRHAWGNSHPKTLRACTHFSLCCVFFGKAGRILPFLDDTIQRQRASVGPEHHDLCLTLVTRMAALATSKDPFVAWKELVKWKGHLLRASFPELDYDFIAPLEDELFSMSETSSKKNIEATNTGKVLWPCLKSFFRIRNVGNQSQVKERRAYGTRIPEAGDSIQSFLMRPFKAEPPLRDSFPYALQAAYNPPSRDNTNVLQTVWREEESRYQDDALVLNCALAQTFRLPQDDKTLLEPLCNFISTTETNKRLIGENLVVAAERQRVDILRTLMGYEKCVNASQIRAALDVAVAQQSPECIQALLPDTDHALDGFNRVIFKAVHSCDATMTLPLLVENMNPKWSLATTEDRFMSKTELQDIATEQKDWGVVRTLLDTEEDGY